MKEATVLKIVVGHSSPYFPSGFSGAIGWIARITKPYTKSTVLKTSIATVYCFQSCSPESRRSSNQRKRRGARYLPSMIRAMYRLSGIETSNTVAGVKAGSSHMGMASIARGFALEPLRADQRREEVDEEKHGYGGGQIDHGRLLRSSRTPAGTRRRRPC